MNIRATLHMLAGAGLLGASVLLLAAGVTFGVVAAVLWRAYEGCS